MTHEDPVRRLTPDEREDRRLALQMASVVSDGRPLEVRAAAFLAFLKGA